MSPAADPQLARLVEIWHQACAEFVALARSLTPEQGDLPTDLPGWTVKDNVAHTAHLEAVLAGTPEDTVEVPPAPHLTGPMSRYTEQGVLARRDRDVQQIADEIEQAVAVRYAELRTHPPADGDAAPPRTPGGAGWNFRTLLGNRPFDVWMHEQDIRRAVERPGGYDCAAAAHVLATFGRGLPMVVGKRLAPPPGTSVRLVVPDADLDWTIAVGDDGRAAPVTSPATDGTGTADVTLTLSPEDFVVLSGGRRPVSATHPRIDGDVDLGQRLLGVLAVTP